ncbi:MAG: carboxylating nicotinate-nucleotide diphosphorylase [Anaerolineae bacterium]|nr:carboxylating nicotinate-nucleotide diphosphorylase [Anaerolineae bacterium]
MNQNLLWNIIERAIEEDAGSGDVTSMWALPGNVVARTQIVTHDEGILAGVAVAEQVFNRVNALIGFSPTKLDGETLAAGDTIASAVGPAVSVLTAERSALNFMQRMSGIATLTHQYVEAIKDTNAVILSTRQTAPGLRLIDQWAVQIGGGGIHRSKLDDMVYIRDNHIALAGGITAAMESIRKSNTGLQVAIEVRTWAELDEALPLDPDRITLSQMSVQDIKDAVKWVAGRMPLEVSGGITLDNVREIAETGVDYISVSALARWFKPLHIHLEIEKLP